ACVEQVSHAPWKMGLGLPPLPSPLRQGIMADRILFLRSWIQMLSVVLEKIQENLARKPYASDLGDGNECKCNTKLQSCGSSCFGHWSLARHRAGLHACLRR